MLMSTSLLKSHQNYSSVNVPAFQSGAIQTYIIRDISCNETQIHIREVPRRNHLEVVCHYVWYCNDMNICLIMDQKNTRVHSYIKKVKAVLEVEKQKFCLYSCQSVNRHVYQQITEYHILSSYSELKILGYIADVHVFNQGDNHFIYQSSNH